MRAHQPNARGCIERDGVRVGWERFGDGEPAVLFLCVDAIVDSRMWKAQVAWLSIRHTVITIDPRGNVVAAARPIPRRTPTMSSSPMPPPCSTPPASVRRWWWDSVREPGSRS